MNRRVRSLRTHIAGRAAALALLGWLMAGGAAPAQNAGRTVHGVVLNARDAPIPGAIVYMENTRTQAVRTYIADDQGKYEFGALEANVTYELHAEFNRQRSPTRIVSAYDTRSDIPLDLKVPVE